MSNSTDVSHDPSTSAPLSPTSTLISTILSTSSSVVTQPGRTTTSPVSTIPITTSTSSLLPPTTSSPPPSTSIPPTTSVVVPITTSSVVSIPPTTSPSAVTSTITVPGSSTSTVVISTSITLPATSSTLVLTTSSTSPSSAATSTPGSLSPVGNDVSGGSGLSTGGKIAIAVVIPIVVVALLVIGGLFLWRRRKQQREAEDLRRKELEDYGYNPNNDPTIGAAAAAGGAAGAASAFGEDQSEMRETNGSGYRGWGGSSTGRKAPTTIGSRSMPDTLAAASVGGAAAGGLARTPSDHWNRDGFANGTGNANGNGYPKESSSSEQPLMPRQGSDELVGRTPPATTALEGAGAGLGAGYAANQLLNRNKSGNKGNLQRGISNASSGYDGARSDVSGEYPPPTQLNAASYFTDSPYPHIPPQDFTPAPVVQDVNARRNTRIESPNIAVHRGEPGIAQNF